MTFPLGETIELQHDANVIRQHRDLDLAPQVAQAERHHSLPQFRCAADVAAFVKRDADFKPLVRHWVSSHIGLGPKPRTGCLWLMGPDVKAGHGLMRVLSFPSPSGWRDQMTAFIGRREFITLLGGAASSFMPPAAMQSERG